MPKLHKIVFTFKFHPLHAKISTPTGTPVPDEKVKELSSIDWQLKDQWHLKPLSSEIDPSPAMTTIWLHCAKPGRTPCLTFGRWGYSESQFSFTRWLHFYATKTWGVIPKINENLLSHFPKKHTQHHEFYLDSQRKKLNELAWSTIFFCFKTISFCFIENNYKRFFAIPQYHIAFWQRYTDFIFQLLSIISYPFGFILQ